MPTVRDNNQTASPVSGGHIIQSSDWGVLPPGTTGTAFSAGANLTNVGSGGSLANGNTFFKITWVTANGESQPSVEASVTVTGGPSGSVTVALASVGSKNTGTQALAAPIIGWNIYSSTTTGTELLNKDANSLSVALSTQVLPNGTSMTFIPIATTSAAVKIVGNGAAPPTHNSSGIQLPLPNIGANNSADLFLVARRDFRPQKEVNWIRPNSSADAGGLLVSLMDCVAPIWPQSTAVTADTNYIVINSTVFVCVISGTTASSIPAGLTTRPAKFTTVVDNTATWMSLGEAALVRARFSNTTGSAGQPIAQEYDLFQA
jgi:hypothetical protein